MTQKQDCEKALGYMLGRGALCQSDAIHFEVSLQFLQFLPLWDGTCFLIFYKTIASAESSILLKVLYSENGMSDGVNQTQHNLSGLEPV